MNTTAPPTTTPIVPVLEPEDAAPVVLTVQQVARMFGCKPRTVRSWIAKKKLPVVRMGRKPFVPVAAIDALIGEPLASDEDDEIQSDIK